MKKFIKTPGYRATVLLLLLFLMLGTSLHAQNKFPVIRATSKVVDVIDGENFRKGCWYMMPEKKPDIYYVSIPRKPHRVMFRTNKDSIAFDTKYGESYDFIIVLKNGDSCHTRIIAKENELPGYTSTRKTGNQNSDTIPITIGKNNKIYIKASINGSAPLNFQFDLGAGGSIIKKGSVDKVKMNFDGKTFLINSDGRKEVPTSSKNTLMMGSAMWNNSITFIVGDNMDRGEDGLLGNGLFMDRVIEINYDKKILIVHDRLPEIIVGYIKQSIFLDGVVPFVRASILIGKETLTDWYMFDTGYSGALRISTMLSDKYHLTEKTETAFNPFKKTFVLPQFRIGDHSFTEQKAVVHKLNDDGRVGGIIGNALLKRYNVILDNQNGFIYLCPNSLMDSPDNEAGVNIMIFLIPAALILLAVLLWIRRRKRHNLLFW
jgi:hypothetical protein